MMCGWCGWMWQQEKDARHKNEKSGAGRYLPSPMAQRGKIKCMQVSGEILSSRSPAVYNKLSRRKKAPAFIVKKDFHQCSLPVRKIQGLPGWQDPRNAIHACIPAGRTSGHPVRFLRNVF